MQAFECRLARMPKDDGHRCSRARLRARRHQDEPKVIIVNKQFADHFFRTAARRQASFGGGPGTKTEIEIVGVVANSLYEGPREGIHRQAFVPAGGRGTATVYVRTNMDSASAFTQIRRDVREIDPNLPVYGLKTVQGQLDETLLSDRLTAMLASGFGILATLLASIGLYGVMAFVVARRTRSASPACSRPSHRVAGDEGSADPFVVGLAVGILSGLMSAKPSRRCCTASGDPTAVGTLVLVVVTIARVDPATRASWINPIRALR